MLKEVTKKLEGNDRFEGYAIELMQGIAGILHFNVTFKLVDDGKYGGMDEHGNWNGMMKEVLEGVEGTDPGADFAVADLSITSQRCVLNVPPIFHTALKNWRCLCSTLILFNIFNYRASALTFSMPWMTLGISIVYVKPRPAPPSLLSFLSPFTNEVWSYTVFGYIFVSLLMFVLAR